MDTKVGTPTAALAQVRIAIPQPQTGMERNPSDPQVGAATTAANSGKLTDEDQQRLVALVMRYRAQWSQDRRVLMQRCLENLEFFKGNQFISFEPGQTDFFSAVDWMNQGEHAQNSDDKDLYQYCNNFYQMLATGFVAALTPQVPKSKWEPVDADQLADVTTAKAAQTLIDIVERQNREQSLLKQQLLYLYTTGAVFRHTRYVVDGDLAGWQQEPVFAEGDIQILPDRWHCFGCGKDVDPGMGGSCPSCNAQLGGDSFFPGVTAPMMKKVGSVELPNGQVKQTVYSPLEVDCDPAANGLRQTPLLSLEVEVHIGSLRAAYPDMYEQIQSGGESELTPEGSTDRIAREQVYSQSAASTATLQDQRPTLSRTWIQPWAFDIEDDKAFGERMRGMFPKGVLMVSTGSTFLSARPAELTREWTWAGTHEGFGMYPPSIGDVVVPFQKRYNDMANILHEFMDRCSSGVTLANADLIDVKAMEGKPLLPGVLNLVKMKRTGPPGATRMADALYQFQFQMHQEAFSYLDKLAFNAQMFAGIPPQVYGGAGDPHVETFGGQQQQLNTALGKLNIYWENLKEEHAQADRLAVGCARDNMTGDLRQIIREKGADFRNQYVRLDDLHGDVRAYADTDQGLPVTAAELRQRWMDLMNAAAQNPVAQAIFSDPGNQEQAAMALGVPNMTVPGAAMRGKVLMIIDRLVTSGPVGAPDPKTGQMVTRPTILPDKDIDDFTVLKATVREYCQENSDLPDENPGGWANLLAYFKAAVAMETQQGIDAAQQKAAIEQAGAPQKSPPPADEVNDVVTTLGKLMHMPPQTTNGNIQGQVQAGKTLIDLADKL